jgi:putative membrane protein
MFANLPLYLGFFGTALGLLIAGLTIYLWITPYSELRLIRAGNRAAAFSLGGTAVGLAITLTSVASSTWRLAELAAWGAVGLAAQIVTFLVVAYVILGGFREAIQEDRVGYGIALGAFSVAVGILNAGALSS